MSFDLANGLAGQGYCITVLCPQPSRPLKTDYSQYSNPDAPVVTVENEVKVVRLPSFAAPESRLLPRIWESFSFGREVTKFLIKEKVKPDVLYVNSWPLLSQSMIARYAKNNAAPMVLQVMDIYPEALTSKLPGFLKLAIHFPLTRLDAWIARQADYLIVISDNMRRTYTDNRRIPESRIATIPTWQDNSLFVDVPDRIEACHHYGIPCDLFTFLYLGNIGPVAGVDFLIRAFHRAAIDRAQLVIVGDGSAKADCIKLVGSLSPAHIHFISDPDAANVSRLQSMAHVCLLPMKSGTGMSSIPSKLPAYLFSAKPVIAAVDPDSDTARLIQTAECGWVGAPEDLDWLTARMRDVAAMTGDDLTTFGEKGRRFGLAHFSKNHGVQRLAGLVTSAVSRIDNSSLHKRD
ncbi:MAG: glycosyltransferase family 4 protein [Geobacteraceae bacterium]|nr:glycosyltransferase family 4 protein [Geobacteraceae bacterium]